MLLHFCVLELLSCSKLWPHHSSRRQALSPAKPQPFILHSPSHTLLPLNPRQLLLNSPGSFCLQTFKYTVPLHRTPLTPFPVPRAPSTPPGHHLPQEATFLRKPPQRWIRLSSVPQGGYVSAILILPGEGQSIVLTWVFSLLSVGRNRRLGLHILWAHL